MFHKMNDFARKIDYKSLQIFSIFASLYLLLFGWQIRTNWGLLQFWQMKDTKNFGDLSLVIEYAGCYSRIGVQVYGEGPTGDCHGYLYGQTLLKAINIFHLNFSHVDIIAISFLLLNSIIYGVLSGLLFKESKILGLISILLFFSPATILLTERANIDAVIFIIITVIAIAYEKQSLFAFSLATLATLFKYYPVTLYPFLIFAFKKRISQIVVIGIMGWVIFLTYLNIKRVETQFFDSVGGGFGNQSTGIWLRNLHIHPSSLWNNVIGIIMLALMSIIIWQSLEITKITNVALGNFRNRFVLFQGSVFIVCYIMGMNCDYRLVFGISAGVGLILDLNLAKIHKTFAVIALAIIPWCSYNSEGAIQFLGDLLIQILVSFLSIYIIVFVFSETKINIFKRGNSI